MICVCVIFILLNVCLFVPSFVHYLEVLEGADGDKMPGKRMWGFTIFLIVVGLG